MESFKRHIGADTGAGPEPGPGENPFVGLSQLPSFARAEELLLDEALARSGGRQTLAARLLGVTQSALSKRLKALRQGR